MGTLIGQLFQARRSFRHAVSSGSCSWCFAFTALCSDILVPWIVLFLYIYICYRGRCYICIYIYIYTPKTISHSVWVPKIPSRAKGTLLCSCVVCVPGTQATYPPLAGKDVENGRSMEKAFVLKCYRNY